jgi:hypothetical protein
MKNDERYMVKDGKIFDNGVEKSPEIVCRNLNDYWKWSNNKDRDIAKLREINELQSTVIDGVVAYFHLKERWY